MLVIPSSLRMGVHGLVIKCYMIVAYACVSMYKCVNFGTKFF